MTLLPPIISFAQNRPFFPMVRTFLVSAVGLGPVLDPRNPLGLDQDKVAVFTGRIQPQFAIDMGQVRKIVSDGLTADEALNSLCSMLINAAYAAVKDRIDQSPEFEFFRHVRNASAHGNRFSFRTTEPYRPASWRGVAIDHGRKGTLNPLHGTQCFGLFLNPADGILLLSDIEQKLP